MIVSSSFLQLLTDRDHGLLIYIARLPPREDEDPDSFSKLYFEAFYVLKKTASFFIKVANISPHTDWSYQYTYYSIAQNSQVCLPIE